jgi:hypothetical protein
MIHRSIHLLRSRLGRATVTVLASMSLLVLSHLSVMSVEARPHSQGGTIVRCDPSTVIGPVDQTLTVDLYVQDVTNLYGLDLKTTFDATIAQVVDENSGTAGVQFQPLSTFMQPDFVVRNVADNSAGTLRYAATQVDPTAPATGSGPVARIRFAAVKAGQLTMVFTAHDLSDRNGGLISNTAGSCSITFEAPTAVSLRGLNATRVSWVGMWPLAGLGVATVVYGLLRRRRAH